MAGQSYGCFGIWLGASFVRGLRLKVRLFNLFRPIPAAIDFVPYADSVTYDNVAVSSIRIDFEWSGIRTGGLRWPLGIMGGPERVGHFYRTAPYGPTFTDRDEYFILEPWVGIHLVRRKNAHGIRPLFEMFTVAVGYRVPFHPKLPGYRARDFAGPVLCFTVSGPQR